MNYADYSVLGTGLSLPFNNTTWIGFSFILLIGIFNIAALRRLKVSIFHLGYAACIFLMFLPMMYSDTTFFKYEYMVVLGVLAAFIMTFIISQYKSQFFRMMLLKILLISSLIQSILGLIQYYLIHETSVFFPSSVFGTPTGVFDQVNVFSTYINLGSLLALYFYFKSSKNSKVLLLFVMTLLIVNAHLNVLGEIQSGRIISLIAIALFLLNVVLKDRKYLLPVIFFTLSVMFSFMPKQWFDVRSNDIQGVPIAIESLGARPLIYGLSTNLILEHPFTGHGIGHVRVEFMQEYAKSRLIQSERKFESQVPHVHNEILQWTIQLGILSGLSFFVVFGLWIWGLKTGRLDPRLLLLGLPFVGHSMLELPFYASAPHLLAFAIILGVSIKTPTHTVKINKKIAMIAMPFSIIICFQIVSLMLASLQSNSVLYAYIDNGAKDISLLENVKPTQTFKHRFQIEKFEWKLKKGFEERTFNKDDIYALIKWAEEIRAYYPLNKVYVRLAQAYIISNDIVSAEKIVNEALLFFPDDKQVIDKMKELQLHINKVKQRK